MPYNIFNNDACNIPSMWMPVWPDIGVLISNYEGLLERRVCGTVAVTTLSATIPPIGLRFEPILSFGNLALMCWLCSSPPLPSANNSPKFYPVPPPALSPSCSLCCPRPWRLRWSIGPFFSLHPSLLSPIVLSLRLSSWGPFLDIEFVVDNHFRKEIMTDCKIATASLCIISVLCRLFYFRLFYSLFTRYACAHFSPINSIHVKMNIRFLVYSAHNQLINSLCATAQGYAFVLALYC